MANTISAILPILQDSAAVVGREQVGFIPACFKNISAARAGLNQTVNYPIVPQGATASVTPAATSPGGTDMVVAAGAISMSNLKKYSWNWTGEQMVALKNGDIGPFSDIFAQTLQQGMRTLCNEIETALWVSAYTNASRSYGVTAGTAPFATANDLTELANLKRILDDNGAPPGDRAFVAGSDAIVNLLGKQTILTKVNEAGGEQGLRQGSIGRVFGFDVFNSTPITTVTAGTGASATTNNAGYAIGATTITLASAGTGTLIPGDIVTIATENAAYKYVLTAGDADVSNGGTMVLGGPGLRAAIAASARAITVLGTGSTYTRHIGFQKQGLHLVMRAPDDGDDGAADTAVVQDPKSGLVFQLARYGQYMQSSWELRVLYGVAAPNPHLISVLYG
jgi:hypothetical protein